MDKSLQIGIAVSCLSHEINRSISVVAGKETDNPATGVQAWILRYLYDNRDREVFQKDLENKFSARRSTMTSTLQLMEKKGMITKEPVERDARLKRICLTDKSAEIHERIRNGIDSVENIMRHGIDESELNTFFKKIEKIKFNLKGKF